MENELRRAASLVKVLEHCESARLMVVESISGLTAVNAAIAQALEYLPPIPASQNALKASSVAHAMQGASEKLLAAIKGLEKEIRDRQLLEHQFAAAVEQEEGARHASLHDSLTGVPNRALFDDRFEHALAQAKRHSWMVALMFVDLDNFKQINDQYGHDVGDSVLRTIAHRLEESTRVDDTVSRHGGDEFLYLAVDVQHEANVSLIAKKLLHAIQVPFAVSLQDFDTTGVSLRASIGISIFPRHGTEAGALLKSADKAMYRAKQTGSGYSFAE